MASDKDEIRALVARWHQASRVCPSVSALDKEGGRWRRARAANLLAPAGG